MEALARPQDVPLARPGQLPGDPQLLPLPGGAAQAKGRRTFASAGTATDNENRTRRIGFTLVWQEARRVRVARGGRRQRRQFLALQQPGAAARGWLNEGEGEGVPENPCRVPPAEKHETLVQSAGRARGSAQAGDGVAEARGWDLPHKRHLRPGHLAGALGHAPANLQHESITQRGGAVPAPQKQQQVGIGPPRQPGVRKRVPPARRRRAALGRSLCGCAGQVAPLSPSPGGQVQQAEVP